MERKKYAKPKPRPKLSEEMIPWVPVEPNIKEELDLLELVVSTLEKYDAKSQQRIANYLYHRYGN